MQANIQMNVMYSNAFLHVLTCQVAQGQSDIDLLMAIPFGSVLTVKHSVSGLGHGQSWSFHTCADHYYDLCLSKEEKD